MAFNRKFAFTNDDLRVLQAAFDLASADLKLGADRHYLRSYLASLVFEIAAEGETDAAEIRSRSVRRFRRGHDPDPPVPPPTTLPRLAGHRVRYPAGVRVYEH
ncbi:MAG: hypothetical protein AB7S70_13265 [Hyphomicrobium sp.]|uniref:hypothetical protein n=1 Tax=Hyphomicrobium sp. TaxID=82 RepID=UPI003D0B4403